MRCNHKKNYKVLAMIGKKRMLALGIDDREKIFYLKEVGKC